ncbi:MAG: DUF2390 domain-containing protein [Coxiellaceae bacterium]|nr:MAG: DUF2390 domain-containing protein [Coxiellaceae bacterium]
MLGECHGNPLNSLLPEHPFWQFSLRVYALPTVADGLLALQREWGLDINFCFIAAGLLTLAMAASPKRSCSNY